MGRNFDLELVTPAPFHLGGRDWQPRTGLSGKDYSDFLHVMGLARRTAAQIKTRHVLMTELLVGTETMVRTKEYAKAPGRSWASLVDASPEDLDALLKILNERVHSNMLQDIIEEIVNAQMPALGDDEVAEHDPKSEPNDGDGSGS